MVANLLLICSAAVCGALLPVSESFDSSESRFFLTCKGTMHVAGAMPASAIIADGIVDLAKRRVYGFGVGGEPIVLLTGTLIGFATPAASDGQVVDGSIDRHTGKTTISVRSSKDPSERLIDMDLDCQFQPQILSD